LWYEEAFFYLTADGSEYLRNIGDCVTRLQGFTSLTIVFLFSVNKFLQQGVPKRSDFFDQSFPNIFVRGTILGLKCTDGTQKVPENEYGKVNQITEE